MGHLTSVKNDSESKGQVSSLIKGDKVTNHRASVVPGMEHISLEPPGKNEYSSSIYGSRFAAEDLPGYEIPETEMPKEIAYRMIKEFVSSCLTEVTILMFSQ
jgi:glutamate decarboxylase